MLTAKNCFDHCVTVLKNKGMNPVLRQLLHEEENRIRRYNLRVTKRVMRDESDPFNLPDRRFIDIFRLNKDLTANLFNELTPHMQDGIRRTRIPKQTRILVALRFFGVGSYQRSVGEEYLLSASQQTVSRCITEVSQVIIEVLSNQWVHFPQNDIEKARLKTSFMEKAGFPGVIGCIDGTHIAMIAPRENEHIFINRKGFHSKNAQIICGPDLEILNMNARYPGSTNDAFIWRASAIHNILENNYAAGERNTWLLGDSGYPLQPWLMTPFEDPAPNTPEAFYNSAHKITRSTVERCIGLLKGRFRCVIGERKLRYSPEKVCTIFYACGILHNMCIRAGIPMEIEEGAENDVNAVAANNPFVNILDQGRQIRVGIVNRYFGAQ